MSDKPIVRFVSYSGMTQASFRYRTLIPAQGLEDMGYDAKIAKADSEIKKGVYIFSKHFNPKEEFALAKKLKDPEFVVANVTHAIAGEDEGENRIIFDICDNHFDKPELSNYYRMMIDLADAISVGTEKMKEVVLSKCPKEVRGKDVVVIEDPYEFPEREPRFNWEQREVENLLWYGHPTNIKHLQRVWNDIGDNNLMIITQDGVKLDVDGVPFPVVPYSIDTLLWGFAQCDVVILPNDGVNSAKGANRAIEAIRQGIFVVAEPCPAYDQFKEWMFIGNIKEGLEWCKSNKGELQDRIRKAQEYIRGKYSPIRIAEQWSKLLEATSKIKYTPKPQESQSEKPCGQEEKVTA